MMMVTMLNLRFNPFVPILFSVDLKYLLGSRWNRYNYLISQLSPCHVQVP